MATKVKQKRIIKKKNIAGLKTRSGFEDKAVDLLGKYKIEYEYEPKEKRLCYTVPSKNHKYTPDIVINDYYFELKGYIRDLSTRMKYVYIKEQNPDITLVMVFQDPNLKIRKGSKTTYKEWFEAKGIKCLDFKQFDAVLRNYNKTGILNIHLL